MTDAYLGIQVDSASAAKAAVDLDALAQKAIEAGGAVDHLGGVSSTTGRAQGSLAAVTREVAGAVHQEVQSLQRVFEAQNRFVMTTREQAIATRQATAQLHTMRFATANIAAQFQDIAVTSQMGMSPFTIALQQGTQLSQALQMSGGGLGGTMKALGNAFASIISPVSLLTLGFVGLGAASIQALGSMMTSAEDASEALEKHKEWLDEILHGYEAASEAASDAVDQAMRLPQGVVESDLAVKLESARTAARAFDNQISSARDSMSELADMSERVRSLSPESGGLGDEVDSAEGMRQFLTVIQDVGSASDMSDRQLGELLTAVREFQNASTDPSVAAVAESMYEVIRSLQMARAEINSTSDALEELQRVGGNMNIRLSVQANTEALLDSLGAIKDLAPDLRTPYEKVDEALASVMERARLLPPMLSAPLVAAAEQEAIATKAMLDEQERRREATRSARGGDDSDRAGERWERDLQRMRARIDAARTELATIGETTYEIERQAAVTDLLNAARAAGIPITDEVTRQIDELAAEYAEVTAEIERQIERQKEFEEIIAFGRATTSSFLTDLRGNIDDTGDFFASLADSADTAFDRIMDRLLQMANDVIWDITQQQIMGALGGAIGGGMRMNPYAPVVVSAKGNIFGGSALDAYTNTVVDRPTVFPFAKGIGLMGEAGAEAIMPLRRDAQGNLGVSGSGGGAPVINIHIVKGASEDKVEKSQREDGTIDIRAFVTNTVTKEATTPGTGLSRVLRRSNDLVHR